VKLRHPGKIGTITEQALTYTMFDHKRTVSAERVLEVKNLDGQDRKWRKI
jgi:hypothetical protein